MESFKVHLEKFKIRSIIWYEWMRGSTAPKATSNINEALGENTVSPRTVQFWFKRFIDGDTSLEDQPRSGRSTEIDNDDDVIKLLKEQPTLSAEEIGDSLGCSGEAIREHLLALGYTNSRDKWISKED